MKPGIRGHRSDRIAGLQRRPGLVQAVAKLGRAAVGQTGQCPVQQDTLQGLPDLEQFVDLRGRVGPDRDPPGRPVDGIALGDQVAQRLPDGYPGHSEFGGEVALDQPRARREGARHDLLADAVAHFRTQGHLGAVTQKWYTKMPEGSAPKIIAVLSDGRPRRRRRVGRPR